MVFAALGDQTRLALLAKLSGGPRFSIARLTKGSALTRQAITKHLRVLQDAGLVRGVRRGRENLFELEPRRLDEARRALDRISRQWDQALARLKSFVEA
ncbi:MAG: Transcriptional regulator, ArsR family [Phycisphaerales bacterium]|nr:Transcriptional regulator, ArsR family [Phycisphaerales bacterium]